MLCYVAVFVTQLMTMSDFRPKVATTARLARLEIATDRMDQYAEEFAQILEFVGQLESVDTDGVEPMAHPLDLVQRLRADEVQPLASTSAYTELAPESEDNLYLVPRVVE